MQNGTWKARKSLSLVVGLLIVVGIGFGASPGWAQLDCPLPAGVTPPAALPVTAQQVEDGSASLTEFALAARERLIMRESEQSGTVEETAHFGCLIRQEGSSWRSGSTYLVQLTPFDGRVFVHTKDVSLSGGQLKPSIYQAILQTLGISAADWDNPATLNSTAGEGDVFEIAGVPGATGYAFAYFSGGLRQPFIILAGFDLGATHLAEEEIVHFEPDVTAMDVVDRSTLKAFVTTAGEHFLDFVESGELSAISKARVAFRDPKGHGYTVPCISA